MKSRIGEKRTKKDRKILEVLTCAICAALLGVFFGYAWGSYHHFKRPVALWVRHGPSYVEIYLMDKNGFTIKDSIYRKTTMPKTDYAALIEFHDDHYSVFTPNKGAKR